jgi:hypothetical protein
LTPIDRDYWDTVADEDLPEDFEDIDAFEREVPGYGFMAGAYLAACRSGPDEMRTILKRMCNLIEIDAKDRINKEAARDAVMEKERQNAREYALSGQLSMEDES